MWKKIFAAGLFATVGSALFFGAQDASAALWAEDYTSGDWTNVESRTARICVDGDAGQDYGETPIIAEIRAANYLTQFSFDDLSEWTCYSFDNLPDNAEARYIVPVSKRNSLSIEHAFPMGGSTKTMTLQFGSIDDEEEGSYLWAAGTSAQGETATSASVMFDVNGGTGVMPVITGAEVGSSVNLPKSTLTRAGYKFAGWNTKADGTGAPYADEAAVPIAEIGVVTLFAQWNGRAVLEYGSFVNIKMKRLSNPAGSIATTSIDTNIKAIKMASSLPADFEIDTNYNRVLSVYDPAISPEPIYAWFDNSDNDNDGVGDGIIYIYSDATIEAGADMSYMFANMDALASVSALADWDTSAANNMSYMFAKTNGSGAGALSDISALSSWNTSNVTNMAFMFRRGAAAITNVNALEAKQYSGRDYVSWDVSNVTNMGGMFEGASNLSDISALYSWDVSKVMTFDYMFRETAITNVDALETKQYAGRDYVSWDISKATSMIGLFYEAGALSDISALYSWNISGLTSLQDMFRGTAITNVDALETKRHTGRDYVSWDISGITNLEGVFHETSALVDISALASWDTSSVEDMGWVFHYATSLSDISPLASWNTSSVTDMESMFSGTAITNTHALETVKHIGKDYVSWDVSNVADMDNMFDSDVSLSDISALSSWDVSEVTEMASMFYYTPLLTDVSAIFGWDTSKVADMGYMFDYSAASPLPDWYNE